MQVAAILFLTIGLVASSPHKVKGVYHENPQKGNHSSKYVEPERYMAPTSGNTVPLTVFISSEQTGPLELMQRDASGSMTILSSNFQAETLRSYGAYSQKITFQVPQEYSQEVALDSIMIRSGDPTNPDCLPDENCGIGADCMEPDRLVAATLREDDVHLHNMFLTITAAQYMGACVTLFRWNHDSSSGPATTRIDVPDRHVELGPSLKNFYFEYLYPACDYNVDVRKYTCDAINVDYNSESYDYTTPATPAGFHLQFDEDHHIEVHIHDKENGQCGPVHYEYSYTIHRDICTGAIINAGGSGTIDQSWPSNGFGYNTVATTHNTMIEGEALRGCVTAVYKNKRSETICDCVRWEKPPTAPPLKCPPSTVTTCDEEEFTVTWQDQSSSLAPTDLLQYHVVVSVHGQERCSEVVNANEGSLTLAHAGPGLEHEVCVRPIVNCEEAPDCDATGRSAVSSRIVPPYPCSHCINTCQNPPCTTTPPPTTTTTATPPRPHCPDPTQTWPDCGCVPCCTVFTTPPACVEFEGCVQTMPVNSPFATLNCGVHNPNTADVDITMNCKGDRTRAVGYEAFKWSSDLGQVQYGDVKECEFMVTSPNCGCENNNGVCTKTCAAFKYGICPDCPTNRPDVAVNPVSGSTKRYTVTIDDNTNMCGNGNELTYVVNWVWKFSRVNPYTGIATCPNKQGSDLAVYNSATGNCHAQVTFDYPNDCYDHYYYVVKAHTKTNFHENHVDLTDNICWARSWWDCTSEETGVARCSQRTQHDE